MQDSVGFVTTQK